MHHNRVARLGIETMGTDETTGVTADTVTPHARRLALGGVLQVVRAHKGWSVETAAAETGLGHMTWRRLEAGVKVRNGTYAALDRLFHLHPGTVLQALGDDERMVDLAFRLGVDTAGVMEGLTPGQWVVKFALSMAPPPQLGVPAVFVDEPSRARGEPMAVTVSEIVSRLVAKRRSPAEEDALQALLRLLPELASAS